jgi:hypothetical protein
MAEKRMTLKQEQELEKAAADGIDLEREGVDHESIFAIRSMEDELQIWNAIVIIAHTKKLTERMFFGKELEQELVGAIQSLKTQNISESMIRQLELIAQESPNELARAAAKKKLDPL